MKTETHKVIEFPDIEITPDVLGEISRIHELFNRTQLYFTTEPTVKLYLRELNLNKFEDECYKINSDSIFFKIIIDRIKKIGAYGIKGKKRLFVGYDKDVKVADKKNKSKQRQSYFYTKHITFNSNNNPLPDKYLDQIIESDSEEVLKNLPDNCVDFIFTSPPYNFGMDYSEHDDTSFWEQYFNKIDAILTECVRVLKWGGRIGINIQPLYSDYIPSHHIFSNILMKKGLIWKAEILWEKNNYNAKYTAWGSYMSPSSPYLKYTWEFIEVFCKGDIKKIGNTCDADISAEEFKKWTIGKWSIAPERNMKDYNHPAMFPEELVTRALKLFTFKNDVILDPFNGVGTTTAVAKALGRHYLGIDISKEYCITALKRLSNIDYQEKLL